MSRSGHQRSYHISGVDRCLSDHMSFRMPPRPRASNPALMTLSDERPQPRHRRADASDAFIPGGVPGQNGRRHPSPYIDGQNDSKRSLAKSDNVAGLGARELRVGGIWRMACLVPSRKYNLFRVSAVVQSASLSYRLPGAIILDLFSL
jgi:hypothetical protein